MLGLTHFRSGLLLLLLVCSGAGYSQLAINEISQGTSGTKEFAEFVVVGTKTCSDSCADLRGWIFDDNNGFHGGSGIAGGCARFADIPQWQCVSYGTLILIYNPADKNTNITLPDDETDANHDGVYIIPVNSNKFDHSTSPANGVSSASYAGFTFTNGGAAWGILGMANTNADVFQTVSPSTLTSSYFSVGWLGAASTTISFAGNSSAKNYYMNNTVSDDVFNQANWLSGTAGSAEETPGAPNSIANSNWLTAMRKPARGNTTDTLKVNLCAGQTYFAGGALQNTTGLYTDVFHLAGGCDSNIVTNLHVAPGPVPVTPGPITGCGKVTINGKDYFSSKSFQDTLRNANGCDSVYTNYTIIVNKSFHDTIHVCINTGQSYFVAGANQTTSGLYTDTYKTVNNCDSTKTVDLNVINVTTSHLPLQDCNSLVYRGKTYTSSATAIDTFRSYQGCDSFILIADIIINSSFIANTSTPVCINTGQSYFAGGKLQTTTGTYRDTLKTVHGCDSIVITDLRVITLLSEHTDTTVCGKITLFGKDFVSSGVFDDTLRSQYGCDSVYLSYNITIKPTFTNLQPVCINTGQTYFAAGKNQTTTGVYYDTLNAANGCDSVIITDLHVITKQPNTLNLQDCKQLTYLGKTYTANATVIDTLRSFLGCDSIITTATIVIDPSLNATTRRDSLCIQKGQSFFAGGANQTTSGIYTDKYSSVHGCDSIIITDLQVIDTTSMVVHLDSCVRVIYNGAPYTADTTVTDIVLSARGCDSVYRQAVIHIFPKPQVKIAPVNSSINQGDSIALAITPSSFSSILWWPGEGLSSTSADSVFASPQQSTVYNVFVSDNNGCTASDSTKVTVILPELKTAIPSAFSPNGDGKNDFFLPLFTGSGRIEEMHIYNRWGQLVFECKDCKVGWNGEFKGEPQIVGTYIYYVMYDDLNLNTQVPKTGSVTLLR